MSPALASPTSSSLSAPFFSVTSSRPSGRKVMAQGSSNCATGVATNALPMRTGWRLGAAAGGAGSGQRRRPAGDRSTVVHDGQYRASAGVAQRRECPASASSDQKRTTSPRPHHVQVFGARALSWPQLVELLVFGADRVDLVDVVREADALHHVLRVALGAAETAGLAVDARGELAFRAREQIAQRAEDFELVAERQDADRPTSSGRRP